MILTTEQKNKIIAILDSKEFKDTLYKDLPYEKRDALSMFYTPGKICIQMIEKFNCDSLSGKTILDPTCGSGNLLIACLIAGADSDKVFGNEYDKVAVALCKKRINRACDILNKPHIKDYQIHQGNALQKKCLDTFNTTYEQNYKVKYIDDLNYAQGKYSGWDEDNKQAELRNTKYTQISLFDGLF